MPNPMTRITADTRAQRAAGWVRSLIHSDLSTRTSRCSFRDDPIDRLTPRGLQVLRLMAEGRSNNGIVAVLKDCRRAEGQPECRGEVRQVPRLVSQRTPGRARCRPGPTAQPDPPTAISATEAAASPSPASLVLVSRSPSITRASRMVDPGYSDVMTAVTASRLWWVATK